MYRPDTNPAHSEYKSASPSELASWALAVLMLNVLSNVEITRCMFRYWTHVLPLSLIIRRRRRKVSPQLQATALNCAWYIEKDRHTLRLHFYWGKWTRCNRSISLVLTSIIINGGTERGSNNMKPATLYPHRISHQLIVYAGPVVNLCLSTPIKTSKKKFKFVQNVLKYALFTAWK